MVGNGQTPMRVSIATPESPKQPGYTNVFNSNDIKSANAVLKISITTIRNGVTRRPIQPPNTDSSSDYTGNGYNTPYINNVGLGSGGQGDDDGGDGHGGGGNGRGKGQMGKKGFGYGNKRFEFTFVKSSDTTINSFSGNNLNTNPDLPFYKSIKRLIYNQGDDGELLLKF